MPQIPDFIAQSYTALSRPENASRCVNFFPEIETQDSKSKTPVPVWGCPGISPFAVAGIGPVKAFNVMNDTLYAVSGQRFFRVNENGSTDDLGAMLLQQNVSIDNNGVEIVAVDGFSGWQYSTGGGVAEITDPNFYPARTVTYYDGYFVFDRVGTKQFFLSPLFAVTPFDGTQFASKEATSDLLLACANAHEQLYLFGERRIEVWYDAGNAPPTFPFQRSDGAIVQRGCGAPASIVLEDNTIFFLGEDGIYYRLDGFVPERVSNHAVEAAWQSYGDLSSAQAFIYTAMGHKFLTLNFPGAPATWVLDLSTRRWHERESWLGSDAESSLGRWRVNCAINWRGRILVGDSASGQIGQLDPSVFVEWGAPVRGLLIGPPVAKDRKRLFMRRFEIDVETGVGLPGSNQVLTTSYCADPITITQPAAIASAGALQDVAASFSTALFSAWLDLPDDGGVHGVWFSNQTADAAPGNGGMQIGVFNDQSSSAAHQIVVRAWDAANAAIVAANYALTTWGGWVWLAVSIDTAVNRLEVWANTGTGDTALTPAAITWSSANPIGNPAAAGWHLVPSQGP